MDRYRYEYYGPIIRDVRLIRDRNGFGFNLVGQHPCYVDSIVSGGVAEKAGLRPMDCIISINGRDVRRWMHEDIVKEIGMTMGVLLLKIVENDDTYEDEDDDDYDRSSDGRHYSSMSRHVVTSTPKYPPHQYKDECSSSEDDDEDHDYYPQHPHYRQMRNRIQTNMSLYNNQYKNNENGKIYEGFHHNTYSSKLPKPACNKLINSKSYTNCYNSIPNQETSCITSERLKKVNYRGETMDKRCTLLSNSNQYLNSNERKLYMTKNKYNTLSNDCYDDAYVKHHKSDSLTSNNSNKGLKKIFMEKENKKLIESRDKKVCDNHVNSSIASSDKVHIEEWFNDENCTSHQEDTFHDLPHYKINHRIGDGDFETASEDNLIQFVVHYIGSIDLPGSKSYNDAAMIALKHFKSSKKKELVVLSINEKNQSIILKNMHHRVIAQFKTQMIQACCCPNVDDDYKSFVLVLPQSLVPDVSSKVDKKKSELPFMCCHLFRVDPQLSSHSRHQNIINILKIKCTPHKNDNHTSCLQFPINGDIPSKYIALTLNSFRKSCCIINDKNENISNGTKILASLENSLTSSNNLEFSQIRRSELKKSHSDHVICHLPPRTCTKTFNNFAIPVKVFKPRLPDPDVDSIHDECYTLYEHEEPIIKKDSKLAPKNCSIPSNEGSSVNPSPITYFKGQVNKNCANDASDSQINSLKNDDKLSNILSSKHMNICANEDSNLSQNRSICLSLETILDDIAKSEKKKNLSELEMIGKENHCKSIGKGPINEVHRHRMSYSSGAVDKIKQNFPEGMSRVESWTQNFDFLLSDHTGVQIFMEFLKKELCSENLVFWLKCNEFKKIFTSVKEVANSQQNEIAKKHAIKIYDEHLSENSDEQVNIDYVVRQNVQKLLNNSIIEANLFDAAQNHIYTLMKQDKYGRFKTSDLLKTSLDNERSSRPIGFSILNDQSKSQQLNNDKNKKKTFKNGLLSRKIKSEMKKKVQNNEKSIPGFLNFIRRASVDKSRTLLKTDNLNNIKKNSFISLDKLHRYSLDPKIVNNGSQKNLSHYVEQHKKVDENLTQKKDCPVDMIEMISKIQSRTLDDQRGNFSKQDLKLPEFLLNGKADESSSLNSEIMNVENDKKASMPMNCITEESTDQQDLSSKIKHFSIGRRCYETNLMNDHESVEGSDDFLESNKWDEWLKDVDGFSFEADAIIPTNEEAQLLFCGDLPPPPLTIIEKGYKFV